MLDYPDDPEDDDETEEGDPPAYMSQPAMREYADRLRGVIDDMYGATGEVSSEQMAFCDIMITVYHQVVVAGKVEQMQSLFRMLYPAALDEPNPMVWEDLMSIPMTTTN